MTGRHPARCRRRRLSALRTVNHGRGAPAEHDYFDRYGVHWQVVRSLGAEGWSRVCVGYDLDYRTEPYIMGPGVAGKRRRWP